MASDQGPTNTLTYSWDDGVTWDTYEFNDKQVVITELTIEPSSTSLKFLIFGTVIEASNTVSLSGGGGGMLASLSSLLSRIFTGQSTKTEVVIQVDFSNLFGKKCEFKEDGSGDFELWAPSKDQSSNCILGHQTNFWRRKAGHRCYIGEDHTNLKAVVRNCDCTIDDFECDVGYFRNEQDKCIFDGRDPQMPLGCKKGDRYMTSQGYRRLTKTTCENGIDLEKQVELVCSGDDSASIPGNPSTSPASGDSVHVFDDKVDNFIYFVNSTTVMTHDKKDSIWQSKNSGRGWERILNGGVTTMAQNPYFDERLYFVTAGKTHTLTKDKGATFVSFDTPVEPNSLNSPVFEFHAEEPDWIIFTGDAGCTSGSDCHTITYWSKNGGESWTEMAQYVRDCEWGHDSLFKESQRSLVLCSGYEDKSGNMRWKHDPLHLYRSDDLFASSKVIFENIVGFAVSENYMVVAAVGSRLDEMHLQVSMDGKNFAEAVFPPDVHVSMNGYTVLESGTGTIMLDVLTNNFRGREWGTLFISNANGTFYTTSVQNTNRSPAGYVDYEKVLGIEGAAIVNQVSNSKEVMLGSTKKLQTLITYNDGGHWSQLIAPTTNINGVSFGCVGDCQLHLHGYTERSLIKNELSDQGATGMIIGVGNVGEYLDTFAKGDMFMTRDAGNSWKQIATGPHLFEFGDHGGVIVLAHATDVINSIKYTLDDGQTFRDYSLGTDYKIIPEKILTEPDSTSMRFILIGQHADTKNTVTIALDFANMLKKPCTDSDMEVWTMQNTRNNTCILGHKNEYKRRKADSECYIGDLYSEPPKTVSNCECGEEDFECSPGYIRDDSSKCVLMPGYQAMAEWGECVNGYSSLSGAYRKIAKTTCVNGMARDSEQTRRCGTNAVGSIFLWILIPCGILLAVLFFYLRLRKNGGHIRLSDTVEEWIPMRIGSIRNWFPESIKSFFMWPVNLVRSRSRDYVALGAEELNSDVLMDDYAV